MNTDTEQKRGRGRPRLGNVLFARRVSPEVRERLEAVIRGEALGGGAALGVPDAPQNVMDRATFDKAMAKVMSERDELLRKLAARPEAQPDTSQVKALLDDVERLTAERDEWKRKFEAAVQATPNQLVAYWQREYNKLKAGGRSEFDQGG